MDQPSRPDDVTQQGGPPPPPAPAYPPPGPPPASPPAAPQAPWPPPAETAGPAPGVQFAGHGARLGAYILDAILVGIVATVLLLIIMIPVLGALVGTAGSDGEIDSGEAGAVVASVGLFILGAVVIGVFSLLYFPFFWARGGATPGMKVAGIRVVNDRDGSRIGWGPAILRLIGWWVSAAVFYLGFVWILVDSRRRGWHDLLAGTCVISTR
ncbi:MAG TPA: RDD family protein [Candidatus Nanopelagicales bacterium]|nr:RDD family protein [Candidatus Nanopelagicales bacterium]